MSLKAKLQKKLTAVFGVYHFLWAWAGARIYHHASRRMYVIGITGTKGKTTTLELVNAILEAAGKRTALLSSVRVKIGDTTRKNPTGNSMPGRAYIQKFMEEARHADCTYALVEVTSQGVVAHRHRFVDWNMGVLTNLHPEHIESHGSFENYRAAKLEFLKYVLKKGGKVFLNQDDQNFEFFANSLAHGEEKTISFTRTDEKLTDHLAKIERLRERRKEDVPKFLISKFNEENIAVAMAIAKELGIPPNIAEDAVANFEGVPGRMEFVSHGPYLGIVDYAHTPDSLEAAYSAARALFPDESGRLICVLGAAGGGRDTWKRPEFGKIAAHYCDEVILTDEDSYDEKPEAILDEIAEGFTGMPYPRPEVFRILNRREALQKAVELMKEGDIVIATGKGSEEWIHLAHGKKVPWNEKEVLEELLMMKR